MKKLSLLMMLSLVAITTVHANENNENIVTRFKTTADTVEEKCKLLPIGGAIAGGALAALIHHEKPLIVADIPTTVVAAACIFTGTCLGFLVGIADWETFITWSHKTVNSVNDPAYKADKDALQAILETGRFKSIIFSYESPKSQSPSSSNSDHSHYQDID